MSNFGELSAKGVISLTNKYCAIGCLRYELDENGEMLLETAANLAEILEDDEAVNPKQAQRLESDIGLFAKDLASFVADCSKCSNFKLNGKVREYEKILKEAQGVLKTLDKAAASTTNEKEGDICKAK